MNEELVIHITPGPDAKKYTGREISAKWCRRCKRKLVHKEVMLYDSEPSYYGPIFTWECPCGQID